MIRSIITLYISCFNAAVNFMTRLVLILLTACVYHAFVLAEVFLNSYNLVYPPYLAKPLANVFSVVSEVVNYFIRISVIQVSGAWIKRNLVWLNGFGACKRISTYIIKYGLKVQSVLLFLLLSVAHSNKWCNDNSWCPLADRMFAALFFIVKYWR